MLPCWPLAQIAADAVVAEMGSTAAAGLGSFSWRRWLCCLSHHHPGLCRYLFGFTIGSLSGTEIRRQF